MKRIGPTCAASLLLASQLVGCTFTDGSPWGAVEGTAAAELVGADSRAEEPESAEAIMRLLTSHDYAIELHELSLDVESVSAIQAGDVVAATEFDPANPPEGYSLCHNGHCHADSGELVAYADINADTEGSGSGGSVTLHGEATFDLLAESTTPLTFNACEGPCEVGPQDLSSWSVTVHSAALDLTVEDLRTGERSRTSGGSLAVNIPLDALIEAVGNVSFPYHGQNQLDADLVVGLNASFIDDVDWAAALESEDIPTGLLAPALTEHLVISADITRSELP